MKNIITLYETVVIEISSVINTFFPGVSCLRSLILIKTVDIFNTHLLEFCHCRLYVHFFFRLLEVYSSCIQISYWFYINNKQKIYFRLVVRNVLILDIGCLIRAVLIEATGRFGWFKWWWGKNKGSKCSRSPWWGRQTDKSKIYNSHTG